MSKHSYDPNWKLRVVVNNALSPGAQIAQVTHAVVQFSQDYSAIYDHWHRVSNSVVIMSCTAEQLNELLTRAKTRNVRISMFLEPDLNYDLTAVALEPTRDAKRCTSNYPLALKSL